MTLQKLDLGVERELRAQTLPISAAHEYCLCTIFGPERMSLRRDRGGMSGLHGVSGSGSGSGASGLVSWMSQIA